MLHDRVNIKAVENKPRDSASGIRGDVFLVAPLSTGSYPYPFRIPCRFAGKSGHVVHDQWRTMDHTRLTKKVGRLSPSTLERVRRVLQEMFAA